MGQDAIALLRIPLRKFPKKLVKSAKSRRDCVLYRTGNRFFGCTLDQHAFSVRDSLGELFREHDDPRGILFVSDIHVPRANSYDALVAELSTEGWGVAARLDYVAQTKLDAICEERGLDRSWFAARCRHDLSPVCDDRLELDDLLDEVAGDLMDDLGGDLGILRWCLDALAIDRAEGRAPRPKPDHEPTPPRSRKDVRRWES